MEYPTNTRFLGLPLIHMTTGRVVNGSYRRGIAKAWVAIGDVAFGVVSVGGIAVGAVGVGGLGVGLVSVGGAAIGLASVGGVAVGALAVGGAALAWSSAMGGLAVARDMASGGVAIATHTNDPAAVQYFSTHPFFRVASWGLEHSSVLVLLPAVVAILAGIRARAGRRSERAD